MVRVRFLWEMGSCQAQDAGDGQCNAFKFNNNTGSCDMAQVGLSRLGNVITVMLQLTYLEDPGVGQAPVTVMLSDAATNSLKMYCRGGDR